MAALLTTLNRTSAFSPTSIAALVGWYDFSDVSTLFTDTARTTNVAADGDLIAGVTDKSGQAHHLVQATSGNRPAFKVNIANGNSGSRHSAVRADRLTCALGTTFTQPNTVFLVEKCSTNDGFLIDGSTARNLVYFLSDKYSTYAGTLDVASTVARDANYHVWVAQYNGASTKLYVDGGSNLVSGNPGAQGLGTTLTIGTGNGGANPPTADIMQVLIYNAALTAANINSVGSPLASKYGLTWTTAV